MPEPCAIWGTPAKILPATSLGSNTRYDSPRAGGRYQITMTAERTVVRLSDRQKAYLTTWLMEQRRLGLPEPIVTSEDVTRAETAVARNLTERRDGLLQAIFDMVDELGKALVYYEHTYHSATDATLPNPHWANEGYLIAATESVSFDEMETLIGFSYRQELVRVQDFALSLTFDGYSRVADLNSKMSSSTQAFVAMWFGTEVAAAYDLGIAPAIIDSGYRPMRIDQKEHNNKIDDEIIAEIRRSKFLIADFTCGLADNSGTPVAIPRGGVYYEAGFAQGLGIPVIWCCREDHIGHVHFDTRQFNHITWRTPEELRGKLRNRIGAVIGDGPMLRGA